MLDYTLSLPDQEYTFLCGDLNGYIGRWRQKINWEVGPFCFGTQNSEVQRPLPVTKSSRPRKLNPY